MYLISLVKNQYVAAFSASMTVMICGSCFAWCTPLIPKLTGPDAIVGMTAEEISWMVSIVEVGSLIAPIPSGMIADRCGRKLALLSALPSIIASWLIILFYRNAYGFYIARVLQGHALAVVFTVCPMYLGEIASVKARGGITSLVQTMWYIGFLWQFCTGSFLSYTTNAYVNLTLTIAVYLLFVAQPESPYYLMMKEREDEAGLMLQSLRCKTNSNEGVSKEIAEIKESLQAEKMNTSTWRDLIATAADRRILLITQVLTAVRVCCGTVSISTYLKVLLNKADWHEVSPETCMVLFSSVSIVTIIIATFTIDCIGRLPLLIVSEIGSAVSSLTCAAFFWLQDNTDAQQLDDLRWFPAAALISFAFFFSLGLGPVTQTIQSELFPSHTRGYGSIVAAFNMTFASFLTLRSFQLIANWFGLYADFLVFAAVSTFGLIFTCVYVPETKGKTFYEIRNYFLENTKTTMKADGGAEISKC